MNVTCPRQGAVSSPLIIMLMSAANGVRLIVSHVEQTQTITHILFYLALRIREINIWFSMIDDNQFQNSSGSRLFYLALRIREINIWLRMIDDNQFQNSSGSRACSAFFKGSYISSRGLVLNKPRIVKMATLYKNINVTFCRHETIS